ncbi:MAG: hypothetical protein Q7U54_11060 [Bacteroidales bacterium]|nr:hypothetical protein [Bacteroidales bacterium]
MKKYAFLFFMVLFGLQFCVTAQVSITSDATPFHWDFPPGYNKVVSAEKEKGLEGTPWLTESWVPGTVLTISGTKINGLNYRYNVYRNRLYFQFDNKDYVVGSPDSIQELLMDNGVFVYDDSDPSEKVNKRFMEVVVDGKARLYVNYYPQIIPANFNIILGTGSPNETVSVKENYLIKVGDVITVVDKKGKLIPVALGDKKKEITEFLKKERISPRNLSDLEKVVRYYNSL